MKVLHLFSNHKFTGPADLALILADHLLRRGVHVTLGVGRPPRSGLDPHLDHLARARGIPVTAELELPKHGKPFRILSDVKRLRRMLRRDALEVIHCHLPNDHLVAVIAAKGTRIPVIRSLYDADPPRGFRARVALRGSSGILVYGREPRERLQGAVGDLGIPVETLEPAVDARRFSRARDETIRRGWGASSTDFVVGVIARMQKHRRFPMLLEGFAEAANGDPGIRLVILGRGTHQETVAKEPARRSPVAQQIVFPGYVTPEEYPRAVPCFDALIFLVPGSDGTCRAAREALYSGVPVIASRRGLLPEIVDHERTGLLLAEESPAAIAAAIRRLRTDPRLRRALAAAAADEARARFDASRQAAQVEAFYHRILRLRSENAESA